MSAKGYKHVEFLMITFIDKAVKTVELHLLGLTANFYQTFLEKRLKKWLKTYKLYALGLFPINKSHFTN